MKLFLSGGGGNASQLEMKFINSIESGKKILYIPAAMDEKKHPYPECLEWIIKFYGSLGFENIVMLEDLSQVDKINLKEIGGMHISGGNTFKLLDKIRKSGFNKVIQYFIDNDLPIAGGSAGAIIFGNTIKTAIDIDTNDVGIQDFRSFDKLRGYDFWPHYDPIFDNQIFEYILKYNIEKIVAIYEDAGIYVDDNSILVVEKNAYVFTKDGKMKKNPGEFL